MSPVSEVEGHGGGWGGSGGGHLFLRYLLRHLSCIIILSRAVTATCHSRGCLQLIETCVGLHAPLSSPSPSSSLQLSHRLQPTLRFCRVTTGTRPCEAVTDWMPRVTRVMMRAQHARLNGHVLAEHLGFSSSLPPIFFLV